MTAGLAIQATKDLKKLPIGPWQASACSPPAAAALLAGSVIVVQLLGAGNGCPVPLRPLP
jgi:hypothetical protein